MSLLWVSGLYQGASGACTVLPLYLRGLGPPGFVAEKLPERANRSGLSAIGEREGRGVPISVFLGC